MNIDIGFFEGIFFILIIAKIWNAINLSWWWIIGFIIAYLILKLILEIFINVIVKIFR